MDCSLFCEIYEDSTQRYRACVQLHAAGIHFFSILPLWQGDKSKADRASPWHIGLIEMIPEKFTKSALQAEIPTV